ncbi:MAG: hypothetical protein ATN34_03690 [Epulopiscium sp. Nele67-Bin002]|nr:MAG: hypothetical protein ATN34_03690 [Epulopiscium sp. Nele67-Bin002]
MGKLKVLLVLMALMISGCDSIGDDSSTTSELSPEEVIASDQIEEAIEIITINVASFLPDGTQFTQVFLDRVSDFEDEYSYIDVDHYYNATQTYQVTIEADFATGNEPDVIFAPPSGVLDEVLLDEFVSIDVIRQQFPSFAGNITTESLDIAGALTDENYMVPVNGYYKALYYNKNLFDAYSLGYPNTWENLMVSVLVFRQNDIVPISASFTDTTYYWLEHLLLAVGGDDIYKHSRTEERIMWSDGDEQFQRLYTLGAFSPNVVTETYDEAIEEFLTEQSAMIIEGSWLQNEELENWVQMTTIPYLTGVNNQYIAGFDLGFFVTQAGFNNSKKQSAIIEFINFMTSDESLTQFTDVNGGVNPSEHMAQELISTPLLGKETHEWNEIVNTMIDWINTEAIVVEIEEVVEETRVEVGG